MEIVSKDLGKYVILDAQSVDGKVVAKISVDAGALIDDGFAVIKAKIPGQVDDVILDMVAKELKSAFLGVPADGSAPAASVPPVAAPQV